MIEVIKYEKVNKNKVIGWVDVEIHKSGMVIRRIAHLESGEKKWFNFPAYSIPKDSGEGYKFFPYIQFKKDAHNGEFFKLLHEKVAEYLEKNPENLSVASSEIPF